MQYIAAPSYENVGFYIESSSPGRAKPGWLTVSLTSGVCASVLLIVSIATSNWWKYGGQELGLFSDNCAPGVSCDFFCSSNVFQGCNKIKAIRGVIIPASIILVLALTLCVVLFRRNTRTLRTITAALLLIAAVLSIVSFVLATEVSSDLQVFQQTVSYGVSFILCVVSSSIVVLCLVSTLVFSCTTDSD